MLWSLVLVPGLMALLALAIPSNANRPWVVPATGLVQTGLVAVVLATKPAASGWLGLDPLDGLVLGQVTAVYLLCALYAPGYLQIRPERDNRVFCAAYAALPGTLALAVLARRAGLLWVGLEASTLLGAPLLYFNRNRRSIEATWKYLLVCGVGMAIALLGSFFLAYAALEGKVSPDLAFDDLAANAPQLSKPWLRAALALLFVGYGTKMGLAPMHTWKPDAYGETPGIVGAVFAGAITSVAFVGVLRAWQIAVLAGEQPFAGPILVALGLLSMGVGAAFVVRQNDFKRLLAYSSIEHMGILALGVGLGGIGTFGALYHLLNNGFTKGVLFLAAGNIHRAFRSKLATEARGAFERVPASAALLLLGFFAATGAPPFGTFFSELLILQAALSEGRWVVVAAYLIALLVVFVGMGITVLQVVQGEPAGPPTEYRDDVRTTAPIAVFLVAALLLGIALPDPLLASLKQAATWVGGR